MTDSSFKPVLYLKHKCPFSMKPWLLALEAGLEDQVEIRSFAQDTDEEKAVRAELEGRLEKVTFPAAQMAPGEYMTDSDAIVGRLAERFGVDPAQLPAFSSYVSGPFQQLGALYRENAELKKQQA